MGSLQHEPEAVLPGLFLSLGLTEPGKGAVEFPCVLALLSCLLETIIQKNEQILESMETKELFTMFHGLRAPKIGIRGYIERIFKYSKCSPSCFVLAYIYIDRLLTLPDAYLTSLNVHRLLITGVVVAAKFIDDGFYNNAYYARIGGVTTAEMNALELNFLFSLDFKLQVSIGTFQKYCLQLDMNSTGYRIERSVDELKEQVVVVKDSNRRCG